MNNVFKNKNRIDLEEGFYLTPDGFRGIVLNVETEKTRKKIDKETKKPTGEEEQYVDIENYYFPVLGMALKKYVELSQNSAKNLEEVIEKTDKILTVVEEFKTKYKNF